MASIDLFFDDIEEGEIASEVSRLADVAAGLELGELYPIEHTKEEYLRGLRYEEVHVAAQGLKFDEDDLFADDLELADRREMLEIAEFNEPEFNSDELFEDDSEDEVAPGRPQDKTESAWQVARRYDMARYLAPPEFEITYRTAPDGSKIPFEKPDKRR